MSTEGMDVHEAEEGHSHYRWVVDGVRDARAKVQRLAEAHSHRPAEILRGLEIGVDNFEHTGLTTAPEYPPDASPHPSR